MVFIAKNREEERKVYVVFRGTEKSDLNANGNWLYTNANIHTTLLDDFPTACPECFVH